LNSTDPQAYFHLGNCYRKKDKSDEAIKWLKKGLEFNPKNEEIYINLGTLLFEKGQIQESINLLKKSQ
jgi:tetratricopeptide (TPR) repeat protein